MTTNDGWGLVQLAATLFVLAVSLIASANGQGFPTGSFFRPGQEPSNVINSLLTPILPRSECTAAVDNRVGLCMPRTACLSSGGYVAGACGFVMSCCVYQGTCRSVVTSNETYFVSPNYPSLLTTRVDPPICIFTLHRNPVVIKYPVCQVRIDFDEFSLAPHYEGACGNGITDSFLVSGAVNFNQSGLPTNGLCGELTGQHIYLDVDPEKTDDPLLLIVNTANQQEYNRKWSIRIRQIPCRSSYRGKYPDITLKAPPGCLQYFTGVTGNVESFNYRTTNLPVTTSTTVAPGTGIGPGPLQPNQALQVAANYLNNLNYGICVARLPKMCAIKWNAIEFDFGGGSFGSSTPSKDCVSSGGGLVGNDADFLVIPFGTDRGRTNYVERFCGMRFSPSITESSLNEDVFTFNAPFSMYVHSDNQALSSVPQIQNQRGFLLKYTQIPC